MEKFRPYLLAGAILLGLTSFAYLRATNVDDLAEESSAKCVATENDSISADLITQKVREGAVLIEKEGEAAFPKFRGKDSSFIFSGTYIWIHSPDGLFVMHPVKPKLEGRESNKLRDVKGNYFIAEMNRKVKTDARGEAWVKYMWVKPGDNKPTEKMSFVKLVKNGNKEYIVGCGTHSIKIIAEVEKLYQPETIIAVAPETKDEAPTTAAPEKPAEVATPVVEPAKPADVAKPAEVAKPADVVAPVAEPAKPADVVAPVAEPAKPAEQPTQAPAQK